MHPKRLVIVDGYSLLYRAFFGTRFLSTTDGRPTNALFGLVSMLFLILEQQKPDAVLVALDAPGKTFRHAEFAEYKGTRRDMPPEMTVQMPIARELIEALSIPQLELVGYEADDIIGTISRQAEANGYHTTIISGDLDGSQLVDDCITLMTPKVGVSDVAVYDVAAVQDRFGVPPTLVTDWKALVGDTSDNIPGVPGVGDKTATKLINDYGTVEEIIEKIDQIEEKFRKKLVGHLEQLPKSKWLATIDRHVPIEWDFAPYHLTAEHFDRAKAMLESLEFRNHLRRIGTVLGRYIEGSDPADAPAEVVNEAIEIGAIAKLSTDRQLREWLADRRYALTFPTTMAQGSMFDEPEVRQAVLATGRDVAHVPAALALDLFAGDPSRAILHDSKLVYGMIGPTLAKPGFDTMLAGYVLQSGRSQYVLRDLIQGYLDFVPPETPEQVAVAQFHLEGVMRERLGKESQTAVLDDIELPLVPILNEMEREGIQVSPDYLLEFSKSLQVQIAQVQSTIYEMAGQEFLIASPKQLGEILFEKMAIPGAKKTKTGYATGAEVLQVLAPQYPICSEIMTWRELTKLKSTYADSLPRMIADDGRIHTSFNQTVAATGRLSSNEPNLQNIPIRTEMGRHIRKAFVARPGTQLASLDYSQIELRLLADMCQDDALVEAFQTRVDVHTVTASLIWNVPTGDVTKAQRRLAKMLNYAVLYGVTDFGLANQLGGEFSIAESKQLITQYFERFPKIKGFTISIIEEARSKGFTVTKTGRRRYFPEIHAANRNERLYAERQAVNAPIQGSAADMVKIAMIHVRESLATMPEVKMLLSVHDELLFEMPEAWSTSQRDEALTLIRNRMEEAMPLTVPVEVDGKVGPNWDDMTPVDLPR